MAGYRLVVGGRFHPGAKPRHFRTQVSKRNPIDSWKRAVRRRRRVVRCGAPLRKGRLPLYGNGCARPKVEHRSRPACCVLDDRISPSDQYWARIGLRRQLQRRVELLVAILHRSVRIAQLLQDDVHRRLDARDFAQADRVDLVGGERRRRVGIESLRIEGVTLWQPPHTGVVGGLRQLFFEHRADSRKCG